MISTSSPVALVTGAAKRIGAAIATQLHAAGFRVLVHCFHSKEAARALVAQLNQTRPHSADLVSADLCEPQSVRDLITSTLSTFGQLDLLVNNASIFSRHDDDWDAMFACNVQAPYALSLAAFQHLSATQGAIVNITDLHGHKPLRGYAVYCQSKAALAMQTQALALEFAPHVRVNAVAPGAIAWPEGDNHLSTETQSHIISKTLLKRHGHPQDIAQAVVYLAGATFVTGQTIHVDGGRR